jgi:hypothetical protein
MTVTVTVTTTNVAMELNLSSIYMERFYVEETIHKDDNKGTKKYAMA